jgi:hypothetical protein
VNAVICAGPVPASWLLLAMSVKVTLLGVRVVSGVSGVCCLDLSSGVTGLAVPSGASVSNISLSSDKSIESTFLVVPRSRSSVRQVSYVETQSNVKTGISHTRRSTTGNVLLGGSVLRHSFGSRAAQSAHWHRQYFPGIVYGMSPQRSLLLLTPTALARGGLQSSPLISVDLRLWLRDRRRRLRECPSGSTSV